MIQKVNEPVSVRLDYSCQAQTSTPRLLVWQGRSYKVKKVGLHHSYRDGKTLIHVFSVISDTLFFRLSLDTENLKWTLDEISDGLAN